MMTMKDRRKYIGLTQVELAAKVGTRRKWVEKVEAGKSRPRPRYLRKLAKAMKCTIGDVLVSLAATQIEADGGEKLNYQLPAEQKGQA